MLALMLAGIAGLLLSGYGLAWAADWPAKPVRIVVPFAAGGANDLVSRLFAERLSETLGQQFYVENRGGGGSLIGSEVVARAAPDGYTLMSSGMAPLVLAPAMNGKNATFDPVRDFTHIAYLGGPPSVFVVHASRPVRTFKQLLDYARGQPNGVEYVSPGIGAVGNLIAEYIAAKEQIKLLHVAYRGGGGAILDLVAGHVKVASMNLSTTLQHIRAGTLRPLAVSSAGRLTALPDVPTLTELGYPELAVTTWHALSGPAGLSTDIVEKLNREVNRAIEHPKVREHMEKESIEPKLMTPEETTRFVTGEVEKWGAIIKAMNIVVQ